jgi:putative membrane protein
MPCRLFFFLLLLVALVTSASGQQAAVISTELNGDDLHFLSAASEIGVMQIKLNEIARARSSNYAVTTFSESLTRDQIDRNLDLKLLAATKGVPMATELNAEQKKVMEKLGKLYGEEFDRVFMEEIVQAQLGAIAEFEKTAAKAADADIKDFAAKTLPALSESLFLSKKITGSAYRARAVPLLRNSDYMPRPVAP